MGADINMEIFKEEMQSNIARYEQKYFICFFSRQARAKKSACADFFAILENNIDTDVVFKEAVKSIVSLEHVISNEEFKMKIFSVDYIDKVKRSRYDRRNLIYLRVKQQEFKKILLQFTMFVYS